MRPEDRRADLMAPLGGEDPMPPLDVDLSGLDAELREAGAQASRSLHGRTQPTRVFTNQLRSRMLGAYPAATAAGATDAAATDAAAEVALPRESVRGSRLRAELEAGEDWAPMPLLPRVARRAPTPMPRARWSLLAAAALTGVVVVGAIGARLDWLVPSPTAQPTDPPASLAAPAPDQTPRSTAAAVSPVPSAAPVVGRTNVLQVKFP